MGSWIIAALGGVMVVVVVIAVLLIRRARRRAAIAARLSKLPAPRHPIVLAHGLLGFDVLDLGGVKPEYFRGIPARLEALGATVHVARVSPLGGIEARARQLVEILEQIDARKLHIVAHSMGGLDARFAIARLGVAPRVASLTTIGTPHLGTPIADLGQGVLGGKLALVKVLEAIKLRPDGLFDLTTARMERFNADVPDVRGVVYRSVVGAVAAGGPVHPLLVLSHRYLAERVGPNDGLVGADSQRWGDVVAEVEADHWAQIGWSSGFDTLQLYTEIARELCAMGL